MHMPRCLTASRASTLPSPRGKMAGRRPLEEKAASALRTALMKMPDPHKGKKRLLRRALTATTAMISIGVAGAAIWRFIESRDEPTREAERERPVMAAARVGIRNGTPVIRIDAATQERSGIETTRLPSAPYQDQAPAYGMVLDAAR